MSKNMNIEKKKHKNNRLYEPESGEREGVLTVSHACCLREREILV
jgi:hypothetical protein